MPAVIGAKTGNAPDQFAIGGGKTALVPADIVLQPGAAMTTGFQAPAIDLKLMAGDAGGNPGRLRHQPLQL